MSPKDASADARRNLRLLAGELGVKLTGLSDADQELAAIRFVLDGRVTKAALQVIVDDVRAGHDAPGKRQSGSDTPGDEPSGVSNPARAPRKMHYLATEATEAKMRRRLALAHRNEDARTALYIVPRKPDVLPVDKPHPACLVSAREEHGTVCQRCSWLLRDDPYTDSWLDRDDSTGGRL